MSAKPLIFVFCLIALGCNGDKPAPAKVQAPQSATTSPGPAVDRHYVSRMKMAADSRDPLTKTCDECGSPFFAVASKMDGLCPECSHHLYGYPNCDHAWGKNQCTKCGWDGSRSKYVRELTRKTGESSD